MLKGHSECSGWMHSVELATFLFLLRSDTGKECAPHLSVLGLIQTLSIATENLHHI